MSANAAAPAPKGRMQAIGHRSSASGDSAKPPAAQGPESQTTPAPTGRKMPARGNALGSPLQDTSSPEGAKEGGELPKGWRWVTLREVADIAGGVTKGQKRRPSETIRKVPYLRVANVQRGYLDLTEMKEIDASESEIEALRLQVGDILFNEGGDRDKLGRGWIWNGEVAECVHQNHVFRARVRDSADSPKFISYYGNSAGQKYFYDQGKHTTNLASINLTKLGALPIPLPPPGEQRRIVAEIEKQFTRLEAGVAALRRVQANLKRYRAAVLKAACEDKLVPTAGKWKSVPFRDLIGRIGQGWSPKCDLTRDPLPDEWAIVTTTAVQSMKYVDNQGKPLPSNLKPRPHIEIKAGDFLMTRKGPRKRAGVACLVRSTRPKLMVCDTV